MCTVTWWRSEAGDYGVFFNRDELRTRARSVPVAASVTANGTRFLAPRDSEAGGTWLLANEHGFIAGVLNHYAASGARPPGRRSRGGIPLALADCAAVNEVAAGLKRIEFRDFAPFILLAWDSRGQFGWVWDGGKFSAMPAPVPPVTTSSHRTEEVCTWRRKRFEDIVNSPPPPCDASESLRAGNPERREPQLVVKLASFHADTSNPDGAFNVRMRRLDARTESLCRIEVTARDVRFRHQREASDRLEALDAREAALPRR